VDYRLDKLDGRGLLHGEWLDLGCADGYWSVAIAERGANRVVGVDPESGRITSARAKTRTADVGFLVAGAESLPFHDRSFDGVFLNEVLEHVSDERATLAEVRRVLRPSGHLALFSPNRWFPFEGHGARLSPDRTLIGRPVPLMPWLPARWTSRFATARNYWPGELRTLVQDAGFDIVDASWALAQFEQYPWLPKGMIERYWARLPQIERSPLARFMAVSSFIVARPGTP
jgi:SAM-dependent methyltransferase